MRSERIKLDIETNPYYHISCHCVSGQNYLYSNERKEKFLSLLNFLSKAFFFKIVFYTVMDSHYHIIIRGDKPTDLSNEAIKRRFEQYYNFYPNGIPKKYKRKFNEKEINNYIERWGNLSEFIKQLNERFSKEIKKERPNKYGTVWSGRFFSCVLEGEVAVQNCLLYVALNPVKAGMVRNPKDYRYCSLGRREGDVGPELDEKEIGGIFDMPERDMHKSILLLEDIIKGEIERRYSDYLINQPIFKKAIAIGSIEFLKKINDRFNIGKKFKPVTSFFSSSLAYI